MKLLSLLLGWIRVSCFTNACHSKTKNLPTQKCLITVCERKWIETMLIFSSHKYRTTVFHAAIFRWLDTPYITPCTPSLNLIFFYWVVDLFSLLNQEDSSVKSPAAPLQLLLQLPDWLTPLRGSYPNPTKWKIWDQPVMVIYALYSDVGASFDT